MPQPKQSDIAQRLGLSRVTVTKALNDDPDIAVDTKRRIREIADELGYIPNRLGRQLATNQTMTLGLIVPKIAHSFFAQAVENMYEAALSLGYDLIPMVTFEDGKREERALRSLLSMRVDGLIVDCTAQNTIDLFTDLTKHVDVPLVFFDRMPRGQTSFSSVSCDNQLIVCDLMRTVIEKGYQRVAHLAGYESVSIGFERRQGFEIACRALKLDVNPAHVVVGGFRESDGYEATKQLLALPVRPDFIFAVNDSVAHGAYQAIHEAGLSIPNDIAVAGFGDIDSTRLLDPPLTSIHIPVRQMATAAVYLLVEQIKRPTSTPKQTVVPSTLVVRQSI